MSQLDIERRWIKNAVLGDLEVARFLRAFAIPRISLVQAAMYQLDRIRATYEISDDADSILEHVETFYIRLVVKSLEAALHSGWRACFSGRTTPFAAFKKPKQRHIHLTANDKKTIRTYYDALSFYNQWFDAIHAFITSQSRAGYDEQEIDNLLHLFRSKSRIGDSEYGRFIRC